MRKPFKKNICVSYIQLQLWDFCLSKAERRNRVTKFWSVCAAGPSATARANSQKVTLPSAFASMVSWHDKRRHSGDFITKDVDVMYELGPKKLERIIQNHPIFFVESFSITTSPDLSHIHFPTNVHLLKQNHFKNIWNLPTLLFPRIQPPPKKKNWPF